MPMPKSIIKFNRKGVMEFTSSIDRVMYTLVELQRAALKDTAKLIRRRMIDKLKQLPGMKKSKRLYNSTQWWVRRKESDVQIGFKHGTWYGTEQEFGTSGQPRREILRSTVMENIDEIRVIQGKYLSAIEDENRAQGLIDEEEGVGDEQGD